MGVEEHLESVSDNDCRAALATVLGRYLSPAFGALPKREIDLLLYEVLEQIGYVSEDPSIYSLSQQLRVTRAKGRNLLYDIELRRLNDDALDLRLREALKHPILQKQGDLFALEIENPLVMDHLRSKLRKLHHAGDGSFSPSLVRLTADAYAALMEDFLPEDERENWRNALVKAGAPDKSLKGILKGVLKQAATRVAADAGAEAVETMGEYLAPFVDAAIDSAVEGAKSLFKKDEEPVSPATAVA